MPRRTLTDEEREERRKKAWDPNQFRKGKPGHSDQWRNAAKDRVGILEDVNIKAYCEVLGLKAMPKSLRELKLARKNALFAHHPDRQSDASMDKKYNEVTVKINDAFEFLKKELENER